MNARTATTTPDTLRPATLTLRGPGDLAALGPFLRDRRSAAGFRSAKEAAPHLGVTTRLLVEVERGERTKRGITLGKLLGILQQLGYEVELHPRRSPVVGAGEITLSPATMQGTGSVTAPTAPARKKQNKKRKGSVRPRPPKTKGAGPA